MKNTLSYETGRLIYPGEYVPLMGEDEVMTELNRSREEEKALPPVNVSELDDSFTIEIALPGVKREDLFVEVAENVLSVYAVHKKCTFQKVKSIQLHEFNHEIFSRHIILPENVDPEFIMAKYKAGMLELYLPKGTYSTKNLHTRIVVY